MASTRDRTASRTWGPSDLWQHLQGSIYAWALRHLHGDDASDDVLFDVGFKLKEPVWERRAVILGEEAQHRAIQTVLASARGMDLGVVMPTPGWSCPTCPYAERCRDWHNQSDAVVSRDVFADAL